MPPKITHLFTKPFTYGWNTAVINPININKILTMEINKRLFCIINKDYPFTLKIKYYNSSIENHAIHNITNYETYSYINLRFKSRNDARYEINKINKLKLLVKEYNLKIREEVKKEFNRIRY